MEDGIRLPKRIKPLRSDLSEMHMVFLDCYILGIGDPAFLFKQLIAYSKTQRDSNAMMKSLLGNSDAVAYMRERSAQIINFFNGSGSSDSSVEEEIDFSQDNVRKVIIDNVSRDIIQSLKNGSLDYKQGSIVEKFITKVLDYDEKEEAKPEPPRIYLPESCSSCRYRKAVEDTDNAVDECSMCRYRMDSIERGIEYNPKEQIIWKSEEKSSMPER